MTIRPIDVPGLPAGIEVRRSTRRKRSVGAHREAGVTIVVVPERMSVRDAAKHALALHQRLLKRAAKTRLSDNELLERSAFLRTRYMPSAPAPSSITSALRQRTAGSDDAILGLFMFCLHFFFGGEFPVDRGSQPHDILIQPKAAK